MASTQQPARPRFTSVKTYKHAAGHPTFWYPPEWQLQETDTPHPAVSLYPDPSDEATFISITVQDMGQPLAAEESSLLAEGIEEGLNQLDQCVVERLDALDDVGDWCREWVCTFVQDGTTRRRRARLFLRRAISVFGRGSGRHDRALRILARHDGMGHVDRLEYHRRYGLVDCLRLEQSLYRLCP